MKSKKIINFELSNWFIRNYCKKKDEGMICPFLINGKCANFTKMGVEIHSGIWNTEVTFGQKGCDYMIGKILYMYYKDFFNGKKVERTGSSIKVPKTISYLKHDSRNNILYVYIQPKGEELPFFVPFKTDFLYIEETDEFYTFNSKLGKGDSIKIFK